MLEAVLFDYGDTLFHFAYDEALLEAGWEAGLAALGRDGLPGHDAAAARFRERYVPLLWVPGLNYTCVTTLGSINARQRPNSLLLFASKTLTGG